jgi:hypothetical protein
MPTERLNFLLHLGVNKKAADQSDNTELVPPATLLGTTQKWLSQTHFDFIWLPIAQPELILPSTEL